MAAVKEAANFFGKWFAIPLLIFGIVSIMGILTKPPKLPTISTYVFVEDTARPWDKVPFTKYVAKKKTQRQTLEEIDEQMFKRKDSIWKTVFIIYTKN